jgi:pSer/pThr/pTyr-binding forkhead associated (FHA) protein
VIGGGPIPMVRLTPDNARLRVMNGPESGRIFSLDKMRVIVGRSDPPAIMVDVDLRECELGTPPMVSRRHAELQWVNGQLQLIDLGSANGTLVDGSRVSGQVLGSPADPVMLKSGSILTFGNLELEVVRDER